MMRSVTTFAQPQPHASLGLPAYLQFTSPIRRYGDLLSHFQMKVGRSVLGCKARSRLGAVCRHVEHRILFQWAIISACSLKGVRRLDPQF